MKKIIALIMALLMLTALAETLPESVLERLAELGYYTDDEGKALANFQKANGLSVTGTLDPSTRELIMSQSAVKQDDYLKKFLSEDTFQKTYARGSEGSGVKSLRSQLSVLGYGISAGNAYDVATFYAVAVFQTLNSLEVTGIADPATLARLYSQRAIPCSDTDSTYELSTGSSGMQVKQLQNELSKMGYFKGRCTGIYAAATREAVLAFQRANSLDETGTWSLYQQMLVKYDMCVTKYETDEYIASLSLEQGTRDGCVKELETRLKQLGYFNETPDELFDAVTGEAVMIFQEANGLIATGVADPETRRVANDEAAIPHSEYYYRAMTASIITGEEGYAVLLCSRRLRQLGFPMEEKWLYDDEMEQMMAIFRRACGLYDAEGADMEVRAYMNSESAPLYNKAKLMSDNYLAEQAYRDKVKYVVSKALSAVGAAYEAGKTGPDSYGTAGLIIACYGEADVAVQPTVSLQYEVALTNPEYSANLSEVCAGRQIFLSKGESMITGICVSAEAFVYASPDAGTVKQYDLNTELENYEFAGSVMWD